jgi:ethylmalonyl-CoA mutase
VVGGIIPPDDADTLRAAGVAAVYTPKDFELNRIMFDVVRVVETATQKDTADASADLTFLRR